MKHRNRSRRDANNNDREYAAYKQIPLPKSEQERRAAERARSYSLRYPFPPPLPQRG